MKAGSLALIVLFLSTCWSAVAQDRSGADTPGDWVTTHFEKYGIWTTACDERTEEGKLKQRCYIRFVDVFSESPKFAATFMFVFQKDRKTAIQYAFESGTKYNADGVKVEKDGKTVWTASRECQEGNGCFITSEAELNGALTGFQGGGTLVQDFTDRHGQKQVLEWDLSGFKQAYADYLKQSSDRKLLN